MSDIKLTQKNWSSWHHQLHKEIITKKTLIPKGSNILISVSGGQDSMALLTLINDLKKLHNWSISVWHGDHQWHKKSSLIDQLCIFFRSLIRVNKAIES